MDNYLYFNNDINKEFFDFETVEYFIKNNNTVKLEDKNINTRKISLATSEIRSFITKIIFKEPTIYNIILKFINQFQIEIDKINEYRNNKNLFKFYIKGNMALLMNLLSIGYYKDLYDPNIKFDPSDIDTNLFIDISSNEGMHIENISKSLSQRMFYMYRKILEKNIDLIKYLDTNIVAIANNETHELKQKYKIKSIRKIKTEDRLMFKKKNFKSKWMTSYDTTKHNIMISFNETIDQFLLYRLFIPYLVEFEDSSKKVVNAEFIDLSIVKIDPNLSLYKSPESKVKIYEDISLIIKCIDENKMLPPFTNTYHLEQLLWNKIMNNTDYLVKINYYNYNLNYASLKYLLFEYCIILINDITDIKTPSKIEKIKLLIDVYKLYLKKSITFD